MDINERLPQLRIQFQPICLNDGYLVYGYEAFISDIWGTEASAIYEKAALNNSVQLLERVSFSKITREFSQQSIGGKLFFNLFSESLVTGALVPTKILETLKRNSIDPAHVVIELQEYAPIQDLSRLVASVDKLRSAGIQIALDRYGFGYSNLGRLLELQPHYIKIDARYFIDRDDKRKMSVFASLLQMCTFLNICVIAKNIETVEVANTIRTQTGTQLFQGDYFGRPSNVTKDACKEVERQKTLYREMLTPLLSSYLLRGN